MSTSPKRSVSQHTRADGQKQTANRLGGKFDDKAGQGSAGAAADAFASEAPAESLFGIRRRLQAELANITPQAGRAEREVQALRDRLEELEEKSSDLDEQKRELQAQVYRSTISEAMADLGAKYPGVTQWRTSVEGGQGEGFVELDSVTDNGRDLNEDDPEFDEIRKAWNSSPMYDAMTRNDGHGIQVYRGPLNLDATNGEIVISDPEATRYNHHWQLTQPEKRIR